MIRPLDPADGIRVAGMLTHVQDEGWALADVMIEIKCHKALGSFMENELVALVLYRDLPDILEISWLCTRPSHRRKGLMKRLLKDLSGRLAGGQRLWLELREGNEAALSLYKYHGFQKVGDRKAYYSDGENATLMEYKPLQSL